MGFDKTIVARIAGVTNQNSDTRIPLGDSTGGAFTSVKNPLRGTLCWDSAMFVLKGVSAAGGATGGSYTVTLETDAVVGYTGLPIARATIGPNTATTVVMDNLHQSPGSPLPTHMFIDQTATGGALDFQMYAYAKQYRGVLGTPGAKSAERVLQGTMLLGNSSGKFSSDAGISADTGFVEGVSFSNLGMNRMKLWDRAFYWVVSHGAVAGTHDVDIVATVDGTTFSIASTGAGGLLTTAGQKHAIASNFYGQSPAPNIIYWTEVSSGGVSNARIVMLAKGGRGSMAKR